MVQIREWVTKRRPITINRLCCSAAKVEHLGSTEYFHSIKWQINQVKNSENFVTQKSYYFPSIVPRYSRIAKHGLAVVGGWSFDHEEWPSKVRRLSPFRGKKSVSVSDFTAANTHINRSCKVQVGIRNVVNCRMQSSLNLWLPIFKLAPYGVGCARTY